MPNVVPPMAKTVIRIGIIHRSRPCRRRTINAIAAWMAPVFMVMRDEAADDEDEQCDVDGAEQVATVGDVDVAGRRILDSVEAVDRCFE